jgi:hypothetical protein
MIDTMDPIGGNVSGRLSSFANPPSPRLRRDRGFEGLGFALVRGDDGHDRSFITRDFNRGSGKENGTIPFYAIFFRGLG